MEVAKIQSILADVKGKFIFCSPGMKVEQRFFALFACHPISRWVLVIGFWLCFTRCSSV
jgi:hypothetical protein